MGPSTSALDQAAIHFSPESLHLLNVTLAGLMFAVSLFIERDQVTHLRRHPRALAAGLLAQWLYMPLMATLLVLLLKPPPHLALGLLLVAACPGGNVSNFLSLWARGNVPLAISLVAVSTLAAPLATPALFTLTAQSVVAAGALPPLQIDLLGVWITTFCVVALPLLLGTALKHQKPQLASRLRKPLRTLSGLLLLSFIVVGFADNFALFIAHIGTLFGWVFLLNTLAIVGGYTIARACRLPEADRRALAIETGIHNSGLGLVLIFNYFNGAGAMALIVAWWSVWDILSGGVVAAWWSRRPLPAEAGATAGLP